MTLKDFPLLDEIIGGESINFDRLDRCLDLEIWHLYYAVERYRSFASISEIPRVVILERNIETIIRIRWLRSVRK